MSKNGCIHKKTPDGKINPKYVDLLEEDKPISGQKFVCVSFVSPENILKQKNQFFFQEFLKHYDFSKSVEKFTQFLNFIAYKHNIEFDDLMKNFQEYVKSEGDSFPKNHVSDEYKNFLDANEERLTGDHETCSINEFKYGVSDRGASIRIPMGVANDGKGYLEDRRPASNVDPYKACAALIDTTCS